MGDAGFQLLGICDPRIAVHAIGVHPAWLWSVDGLRLLWCNAAAANAFGLRAPSVTTALTGADPRARQVAQLAERLTPDSLRIERLRSFGKPLGGLLTCACTRLIHDDSEDTVLIVAMETVGRAPALDARLQWLVDSLDQPASAFDSNGRLLASNTAARDLIGSVRALADLGGTMPTAADPPVTVEADRIRARIVAIGSDKERAAIAVLSPNEAKPADEGNAQGTAAPLAAPFVEEIVATGETAASTAATGTSQPDETARPEPTRSSLVPDDDQWSTNRRHPLRFLWQMNAEGRFSLGGDEFSRLLGPQTAAALGRPWDEVARTFGLDPEGRVARAVASRDTWSGIVVNWPFDGFGHRLPVELSALPLHDRARNFLGYRGFGVCHDLDGLNRIARLRQQDGLFGEQTSDQPQAPAENEESDHPVSKAVAAEPEATRVENPPNVVPFRPSAETPIPVLTPVENNAFDEIARRLSEGLGATKASRAAEPQNPFEPFADSDGDAADDTGLDTAFPPVDPPTPADDRSEARITDAPWLADAAPPPTGQSLSDRPLLDLMPAGVLIYRLEQLQYANAAFLDRFGFASLSALQDAGGLEALEIEPQSSTADSASADGMPLRIGVADPAITSALGRLFTIQWDSEPAHALILSADVTAAPTPAPAAEETPKPRSGNQAELNAILEAATDAIVLFDRSGAVTACNRRAQTLFGYSTADFVQRNLTDLFAFESQRIVLDYFESIDQKVVATIHDHGREVVGCRKGGQFLPLSMTMGRSDEAHFFSVFRDLSQMRQNEAELLNARRRADRATTAKSDALAKISHDIRTPLNTIIGFANMMIAEKLGALGDARYLEYTKDIRASAEQVLTIVSDMLDLSQVETGRVKLDFQQQSLNETVEKCVSLAQPQANRERIIIRTSLAHHLPPVRADVQALRQIATNLITSSIRLSKAGGQVIVSTALDERRSVVLRVRDMGRGMSDTEVASTMEPYRPQTLSDAAIPDTGVDLSLTKALAEANHARFQIRTTLQAGTLIEVAFPAA